MDDVTFYIVLSAVLVYPCYYITKRLLSKSLIVRSDLRPKTELSNDDEKGYIESRIDDIILSSKVRFFHEKERFSPSEMEYYTKWYEDIQYLKKETVDRKFDFLVRLFKM